MYMYASDTHLDVAKDYSYSTIKKFDNSAAAIRHNLQKLIDNIVQIRWKRSDVFVLVLCLLDLP